MGKESAAALWRVLLLVFALTGLGIKFGLFQGGFNLHQGRYFTNLSNILAALYALCALTFPRRRLPALRGLAVLALTVTAVVYHIVLTGIFGRYVPFTLGWWGNLLVHTVTPAWMVGEWLLFPGEEGFRVYYPWLWLLFPAGYFAATVVIAKMGVCIPGSATPYPYPFLDVWSLGWGPVLRNVLALGIGFLALGYALVGADRIKRRKL